MTAKGAACTASQALGFYDDGGSFSTNCLDLTNAGGVSPQVQYNNSGVFGGMANVEHNGGHMQRVPVAAHPAPPTSVARNIHYDFTFDAGGGMPQMPFVRDGYLGAPVSLYASMAPWAYFSSVSQWTTSCCRHDFSGGTGLYSVGQQATCAQTGATATPAWASTNIYTRQPTLNLVTATTNNAIANIRQGLLSAWRGNTGGAGGVVFWSRFGVQTSLSSQRIFVGLANQTAGVGGNPSAITDTVYVGCDEFQSTLRACSNDNVGAATCTDLGSNFPSQTIGALYDVWITAGASDGGTGSIEVYVERLDTPGTPFFTSITSDLPRNTVQLSFQVDMGNGTAPLGDAGHIDWMGSCISYNL